MQKVERGIVDFADLLARPGVIEHCDLRSTFGFMAFHGGNLERLTDQIASEAAARSGASFYGVIQPPGMRQHIPSAKVDPEQSDTLARFLDHCDVVVAIHGFGSNKRWTDLLFGGGNRDLARHLAFHVRSALPAYRVVDDIDEIPRRLRGLHPSNPCNATPGGGVQIELSPRVRGLSPLALYYPGSHGDRAPGPSNGALRRFTHTQHLIDGLVEGAQTWAA
ncbi:MAG: poly-gamma-glutamate hydrolase family protein [Acidimicrobiales bacterium]